MNENYIPEEEEILAPEAIEETPILPEPTPAQPLEATAEVPADTFPEEDMFPVIEDILSGEPAAEMPALASETDEAVIDDIILETLAEEQLETENEIPTFVPEAAPEPEEADLDDIILETLAEEQLEAELSVTEIPAKEIPSEIPDLGFEEAPAEEPSKEPDPKKERPARKGRPRRPKGSGLLSIPHMISVVIWLLIICAIGVSAGRIIWVCAADVLAFGREDKEVSISITVDDTMETIADKLHKAGLINIPELFLFYADLTDVAEEHKITTGTFTLNTIYDYNALVNHMGPRATNRVVIEDVLIPEGYNCRQIFALMEEKGICKAADLEAYAASGALDDYWFLEGVERGHKYCLEGYLFPDTYDFYENSTPKLVLEKMLDGFDYRFTQELNAKIPVLNELLSEMMRKNGESDAFIAEHQLDLHSLLTVASLIEEETASNSESYRIASVIYNRLFSWGNNPRYLNIDASIIYALDGKTDLTAEDMAVDSPYNTYTNTGLTPGPISNPGLASIEAALNPESTSYYYYVLNPETGMHQFSKTYAEHTQWVEKFREARNNE